MKKILTLLMLIALVVLSAIGCTYTPPPDIDDGGEDNDNSGFVGSLEEQEFSSALEAFTFGEKYFNEEVSFYETTQKGIATAMGFNTYVATKRFKSDVTSNFLYASNTYSNMNNPDPTFGIKTYKADDADTVFYKRVDGKYNASSNVNGGKIDESQSTDSFTASVSDFNGLSADSKDDWAKYKAEIAGSLPQNLVIYDINESNIESSTFEKDKGGFAYQFSFILKDGAMTDYKRQVELYSKQKWDSFKSCKVDFKMDKFGRVEQVNINEVYVVATSGAKAAVNNVSVEYISYSKRPKIEFLDSNLKIIEPSITYAELPTETEVPVETFKISFDSLGGSECADLEVFYNTELGVLPVPTHEIEAAYFVGWFTELDGRGEQFKSDTLYTLKSDLKLFAFWQYVDAKLGSFELNEDDTYTLAAVGTEVNGTYIVPETYMGKTVVAIGDEAFKDNKIVSVVVLSKYIESIGSLAFSGSSIKSVAFMGESSLKTIKNAAFKDCKSLVYVELAEPLTEIGEEAFSGCVKLSDVTLPNTLKVVPSKAFLKCAWANVKIDIENTTLESIMDSAFEGASIYFKVIPDSVSEIGVKAFYQCTLNVDSVIERPTFVISKNIVVLSDNAFGQFVAPAFGMFIEFKEGSKLEAIGNNAFSGNNTTPTNILSVKGLTENLKTIGDYAFESCNIVGVLNADGKTYSTLELPSTVEAIGKGAFSRCSNISLDLSKTKITVVSDNMFQNSTAFKDVQLPEAVVKIGNYAFDGCVNLTSVNLDELEIESIGTYAFRKCEALVSITLPESLASFGTYAFNGCIKLASINLEDTKLVGIANNTFQNCTALTDVVLPETVTKLGTNVFSGCTALESITLLKADGVVELSNINAIPSANANLIIYVPTSLVDVYKEATAWSNANIKSKIVPITD